MSQEIFAQMGWQQTTDKNRLTTTLLSDERGHALVAVQHIHLQPMGNGRAQPDGEIVLLFRTDAWQTADGTNIAFVIIVGITFSVGRPTNY